MLSKYLKKDQEGNDRLNALSAALGAMKEFTRSELAKLEAHINKDDRIVKYFFALDEESMIEFVKQELNEIAPQPYVPNYDF